MDDALRVRDEFGASDRDLLIGHDWGAIATAGRACLPIACPSRSRKPSSCRCRRRRRFGRRAA